jgi:hypothetical protein
VWKNLVKNGAIKWEWNIIIVGNESEINFNDIIMIKEHVQGKLENNPSLQIINNKKNEMEKK